jgi:polysaccharide chain length determinant protein (PEP-CTERM system associated)
MVQTSKFEIEPYVALASRRKWWIIIPFIISVLGALVFLKIAPKTYVASTLILLEPQSIPDSFVKSTIPETMEGRLRTITQQINSRTNLERIITEFHLENVQTSSVGKRLLEAVDGFLDLLGKGGLSENADLKNKQLRMMKLVEEMRKSIQVTMRSGKPDGGGRGGSQNLAFEIGFEWQDPELVAPVTNAIASRFIQDNLNLREEMAIGTTDFLDQEAAAIRGELEMREKQLEAFKQKNMGMLPDQLQSNLTILTQLREQMVNLQRSLDHEQQQAMLLKSQAEISYQERRALTASLKPERGRAPERNRAARSNREQQMSREQLTSGNLEDLETELARLKSQYTEKHPDIVALKRRIDALKDEGKPSEPGSGEGLSDVDSRRIAPQLTQINANISSYQREIREIEKQIQNYRERVERTPQVEMALNAVLRDYQTVRQRYDSLMSKKLDAKLAEQLEKRQKGEQFRILDPAVKPLKPFKPDALKVIGIALALGLGLGGGLAYLREMLDPCFYNPAEVEAYLHTQVMVSLPLAKIEDSTGKS